MLPKEAGTNELTMISAINTGTHDRRNLMPKLPVFQRPARDRIKGDVSFLICIGSA